MKAFDANLDNLSHDGGGEIVSTRFLSRDLRGKLGQGVSSSSELFGSARNPGDNKVLNGSKSLSAAPERGFPGEPQRLTVASNYFALACPIMPVGLLGAFMLLGGLDNLTQKGSEPALTAEEMQQQRTEIAQQLYLMQLKEKMDLEKQKEELDKQKTSLGCSRTVEGLGSSASKLQSKRKDVLMQVEGKRSERINGPSLLSKQQNDVGKIVKQKMALEAHLEKLSGEQDYHSSCRVSARIELLEKALKKLGA